MKEKQQERQDRDAKVGERRSEEKQDQDGKFEWSDWTISKGGNPNKDNEGRRLK